MSAKLGVLRTTALSLLPLGAFLLGPAIAAVAPNSTPVLLLLSVLPTFLPPAALVVVPVVTFNRTRSVGRSVAVTALALSIALFGAIVFVLAVWEGAGS